jgi:exodeoxyribonuclease VII large subunit
MKKNTEYMMNEPIYIDCHYCDKDEAKRLGARWDFKLKKWFIPAGVPLEPFSKWLSGQELVLTDKNNIGDESIESTFGAAPDQSPQYTVHQFIDTIKRFFYTQFPAGSSVWLIGQIMKVKQAGYADKTRLDVELIDPNDSNQSGAQSSWVRLNVWGRDVKKIMQRMEKEAGTRLEEGLLVRVKVSPQFHSRYHLGGKITDVDPSVSLGAFALAQKKIRAQLKKEKLYDKNKRLPAPRDYCRVAVIHPPNASGYHDFKREADRLSTLGLCEFMYYPSSFEGVHSERDILNALQQAKADHEQDAIDALVILRGGGAKHSLLLLVKESILRQMCLFPVPIITGLGHADDQLLLEEVAFMACDTPSKTIAYIKNTIASAARKALNDYKAIESMSCAIVRCQMNQLETTMKVIFFSSKAYIHKIDGAIGRFQQDLRLSVNLRLTELNTKVSNYFHEIKGLSISYIQHMNITLSEIYGVMKHTSKILYAVCQNLTTKWRTIYQRSGQLIDISRCNLDRSYTDIKYFTRFLMDKILATLRNVDEVVHLLDPMNTLKRGYALVLDHANRIIKTKTEAERAKTFSVQFYDDSCSVKLIESKGE